MRKIYWLLLLVVGSFSSSAWSACTTTMANASFGSKTSVLINSTAQETSSNMVVTCDSLLSLLGTDTITLQLASASTFSGTRATMTNTATGDVVPIRLCGQASCATSSEVAIGSTYTWSGNVLLGLLNSRTYTVPLYFMTVPGQQVSAGNYVVTLNVLVGYRLCAIGGILCDVGTNIPRSLQVNVTVTNDCMTINTPAVSFGSAPLVKNFPTISQNISVNCTKGSAYTIGINNGANAVSGVRYMVNGSARMAYDVYKGSTTNRWGSSGTERRNSTEGTLGTDNLTRTFNYTAKVLTTQATPAVSGDYIDTLIVDIAF